MNPPPEKAKAEKIERFKEFMGWDTSYDSSGCNDPFNPYEDENHFRMLLEKLIRDEECLAEYFFQQYEDSSVVASIESFAKATLTQRCDALISVLDND